MLELVVVILIIFTFSAVVLPRFSDFVPALRVDRAAEELLATARKGHADAALHGLRYRLQLDVDRGEFWLEVQGDPFNDPEEWKPLPGSWSLHARVPDGVTIESEETTFEFKTDGTATEGSIALTNDKDDRVTIKIDATTGRVYFENSEDE